MNPESEVLGPKEDSILAPRKVKNNHSNGVTLSPRSGWRG